MKTADGHAITEGMPVWDDNLDHGTVDLSELNGRGMDAGWFYFIADDGERSMVNGERVCVRHPVTGHRA